MSEPGDAPRPASVTPVTAPRKRRRPALSCEQCRRRKIKCDRTYPCGQCLQSKTASCTYSPDSVPGVGHVNRAGIQKPRQAVQEPRVQAPLGSWSRENSNIAIPSRPRGPDSASILNDQSSDSASQQGLASSDTSRTTWSSPGSEEVQELQELAINPKGKQLLGRLLEKLNEPKAKDTGSTVEVSILACYHFLPSPFMCSQLLL